MEERITLRPVTKPKFQNIEKIYRDGTELVKGRPITEDWLKRNEELLVHYWEIFSVYPDLYLDMIAPADSNFHLFEYQRIFLRACMRYTNIYITAVRAAAKTFLSILAKYLQCMFIPHHVGAIVAPNISQAAKITRQKIEEIWRIWPLLKNELEVYNGGPHVNFNKDEVRLFFKNGSTLSVVGALDSSRGLRTHATLLDEARDLDGEMIQKVILPQMNVSRRTMLGDVNPYEKMNTQVIYATSAGSKSSFAYSALIDVFEKSIMDPSRNFCMGLDYRIPLLHGLLDYNYIQGLKLSPSYEEAAFQAEYLGNWIGGTEDSWFSFSKLNNHRKIKNPEWHAKYKDDKNVFYLISVDVARVLGGDQSVACVFRVNIHDNKYVATLVNIKVLGLSEATKVFRAQAVDIKELIEQFNPIEVVIDITGIGRGLADEMIAEQVGANGKIYPPYGFFNQSGYEKIQPKNCANILYGMIASPSLNSKIHANAYTRTNSGLVRFLISEQDARAALLATEKGAKMSYEDRTKRLMPHELTTKLFNEILNLRIKKSGIDIAVEQINSHFPKDKYSAFAYGLWRIKEREEVAYQQKQRKESLSNRSLVFFTGGNEN